MAKKSVQSHNVQPKVYGANYKNKHQLISEVRSLVTASSRGSNRLKNARNSGTNQISVYEDNSRNLMSNMPSHENSVFTPPEHIDIGRPITSPNNFKPENGLAS